MCSHFHMGQILKKNNGSYMVMLQNAICNKITQINPWEIKTLSSIQNFKDSTKIQNQQSNNFMKNVDIKALALLIKLLEMKYIYSKTLSELKEEALDSETIDLDIEFLNRNISIIDKYLKNAMLKLRIRDNTGFSILISSR
jgi:hypothetical protein